MSSKKLMEQCQKLERLWSHSFTVTMDMGTTTVASWYNKLMDLVEKQQTSPIWMSDAKVNELSRTEQI